MASHFTDGKTKSQTQGLAYGLTCSRRRQQAYPVMDELRTKDSHKGSHLTLGRLQHVSTGCSLSHGTAPQNVLQSSVERHGPYWVAQKL
jgi:hypothetical protein